MYFFIEKETPKSCPSITYKSSCLKKNDSIIILLQLFDKIFYINV